MLGMGPGVLFKSTPKSLKGKGERMEEKKLEPITAMGFYHGDGLVPAWKQAMQFAGKNGRIGTMFDVVNARIATGIDGIPWNNYYTTNSAEYFGYSRGGNRILIVAHGIGPMSTLDGILKAYSYEYKNRDKNNRGGRITEKEFHDLESGKYGEVYVLDFDPILRYYEYPFMEYLSGIDCLEPLLLARLGPRAFSYLAQHKRIAQKIHLEEHGQKIEDPYLLKMGAASNCAYVVGGFNDHPFSYPFLDKGDGPLAHLISTGRLMNITHQNERRAPCSIANEISLHEWFNGTRFIGIRENATVTDIHPGFGDISKLIIRNWQMLMQSSSTPTDSGALYVIMDGGEEMDDGDEILFTQYPKKGHSMDTHEPEFRVTDIENIGKLTGFITEVDGYYGFFRYDIKEVEALRPPEANAYTIFAPNIIWEDGEPTRHSAVIQFCKVKVDTTQRLIRRKDLENDFGTLMMLLEKERRAAA